MSLMATLFYFYKVVVFQERDNDEVQHEVNHTHTPRCHTQWSEQLNPFSDTALHIHRCPERAPHIHAHQSASAPSRRLCPFSEAFRGNTSGERVRGWDLNSEQSGTFTNWLVERGKTEDFALVFFWNNDLMIWITVLKIRENMLTQKKKKDHWHFN